MTRQEAIKDLVVVGIFFIIGGILGSALMDTSEYRVFSFIAFGFIFGGFPCGWKALSKLFYAMNVYTIFMKGIFAAFIGMFVLPFRLCKNIFYIIRPAM